MPRLSAETRARRRRRILDAARASVLEHGLESLSMEQIVAASGMSIGAVYRYFDGKDAVLDAAVSDGVHDLGAHLVGALAHHPTRDPADLLEVVLAALVEFSAGQVADPMLLAVHGWSHAQNRPALLAGTAAAFAAFRERVVVEAERWAPEHRGADPRDTATLLLSVIYGFVVQHALFGAADPAAHIAAWSGVIAVRP